MPTKKADAKTAQVPVEAEPELVEPTSRLEMLETFASMVSTRWGIDLGRKMNQSEANKAVKADATKAREIGATFKEGLATLRKVPTPENAKAVDVTEESLKKARKTVAVGRKPFNEKNKPLGSAIRYLDKVAIPDGLKEVGHPIAPINHEGGLPDWVKKAVEASKKQD